MGNKSHMYFVFLFSQVLNYASVSAEGTAAAKHDKETWPELEKLARLYPEAGVHFQGIYSHQHVVVVVSLRVCRGQPIQTNQR